MRNDKLFDVIVIGGGPGGYRTAVLLGERGLRVALIEQHALGGVCLHEGCIPFAGLLHTANTLYQMRQLQTDGVLRCADAAANLPRLQKKAQDTIAALQRGMESALCESGVVFVRGHADVTACRAQEIRVAANGESYVCGKLVLAVGAGDAMHIDAPDNASYAVIRSRDLPTLTALPQTVDILGAGAAGLEAAGFLAVMGCDVTVLEAVERIGGNTDAEISDALCRMMRRNGVQILTGARAVRFGTDGIVIRHHGQESLRAPQLLLDATGRVPQPDTAALSLLGVRHNASGIETDEQCRTSNENVYACGDVTGKAMLAAAAFRQAKVIADSICGMPSRMDYRYIPRVIFSIPEALSVGMSEQDCAGSGIPYAARSLPMACSERYLAENGRDGGRAKMITDGDGCVIGLHLAGVGVSELSVAAELIVSQHLTASAVGELPFVHPTCGEIFGRLAAAFSS